MIWIEKNRSTFALFYIRPTKESTTKDSGLINLIDFDDFASSSNNPAQMPYSFDPFASIAQQTQQPVVSQPQNGGIPKLTKGNLLDDFNSLSFGTAPSQAPISNYPLQQSNHSNVAGGSLGHQSKLGMQQPMTGSLGHKSNFQQPISGSSKPSINPSQQIKPVKNSSPFDNLFDAAPVKQAQLPLAAMNTSTNNDLFGMLNGKSLFN